MHLVDLGKPIYPVFPLNSMCLECSNSLNLHVIYQLSKGPGHCLPVRQYAKLMYRKRKTYVQSTLHLSSEEHLMHEMTSLVAETPIGYPVGKLIEKWVRESLTNWQMNVSDR